MTFSNSTFNLLLLWGFHGLDEWQLDFYFPINSVTTKVCEYTIIHMSFSVNTLYIINQIVVIHIAVLFEICKKPCTSTFEVALPGRSK